jgi:transposase
MIIGDRAYDSDKHRRLLRQRGIGHRIARRKTEHGSGLGQWRWVIERTFAWLHAFKRLAIRYERRGDIHAGLLGLACCIICARRLHTDF